MSGMADDVIKELFEKWKIVTELQIRRLELGATRQDMADSIASFCVQGTGITDDCLTDCERRRRNPTGRLAVALCKRFGVSSVALLGLGRAKETARWWTWMTLDEKDYLVNRRTLLKSAGLLVPVPDLVYYAQAIGWRKGSMVSDGDVDSAQATATDLAIAYVADPASDTVRAARAHALTLLDLLKPSNATIKLETTRHRLQAVASDACALAGYAEMHGGRLDDADRWFKCAFGLAREAEDRRLEALAHVGLAWVPLHGGDPDRAAALAEFESAATFHGVLPPSARAYVLGNLSWQHAEAGRDLISGRLLEHSRIAAARTRHEPPGWGWWSTHGAFENIRNGTSGTVIGGYRALALGSSAEAVEIFTGALAARTSPLFRASTYEDLALAHVAAGDIERASALGIASLDEAATQDLGLYREKMLAARRTFPVGTTTLPLVRELDERLRLAA